jgi:hypothetical protein
MSFSIKSKGEAMLKLSIFERLILLNPEFKLIPGEGNWEFCKLINKTVDMLGPNDAEWKAVDHTLLPEGRFTYTRSKAEAPETEIEIRLPAVIFERIWLRLQEMDRLQQLPAGLADIYGKFRAASKATDET